MRKITLLITLVFSLTIFSSTSFAEWTLVSESVSGNTYYVDFERIRKVDGYVYWWDLSDYLKPSSQGNLSVKDYNQGDCKFFRIKILNQVHHEEPMGGGTGKTVDIPDKEWKYPSPDSVIEGILKRVCAYEN